MAVAQAVQPAPSGSWEPAVLQQAVEPSPAPPPPRSAAVVRASSREAPAGSPAAVPRSRTAAADSLKLRPPWHWLPPISPEGTAAPRIELQSREAAAPLMERQPLAIELAAATRPSAETKELLAQSTYAPAPLKERRARWMNVPSWLLERRPA